jgi:hypothetical protein
MPYTITRRLHNVFGRKISRFFSYRKAKKLYSEINRDMASIETRFIRSRLHSA